jgi:hypothetical protein
MTGTQRDMDIARFSQLAEAYGGDIERWPPEHRDSARALAHHAEGKSILAGAASLDRLLNGYGVGEPSSARYGSVLAEGGRYVDRRQWLRFWAAGLGLAGVGMAGAAAGVIATTAIVSPVAPPSLTMLLDDVGAPLLSDADWTGERDVW